MEDQGLNRVERELRGYLSAELDRLPVRTSPNFAGSPRRRPRALRLTASTFVVALGLILALVLGQNLRGLRERVAATPPPGTAGASIIVPPHLASPDSIVALSQFVRGRQPLGAPPNNSTVQVINSQTGAERYSIPVGAQAQAVFRAAGSELIVIDWPTPNEQRLQFIDARTGTIKSTATEARPLPSLGNWPKLGAAVSPDGKLLALQQLGGAGRADVLTFYDLDSKRAIAAAFTTPQCGPGEVGFTDDGRSLFLLCANTEFFVIDSGTLKSVAQGALPPRRGGGTSPGFSGMVVIGSVATAISGDGMDRYLIRVDGTTSIMNLGQMFADAIVPQGAIVRVPRQARVFVGYGPSTPGNLVNDARIMYSGSSGGRFTITRSSIGGLLADDRDGLFGADTDGSIWRRGAISVSDDVTLVRGTPGRLVRLLTTLRASAPVLLSRDQAISFVNAPNIRIDRIDRVEAKLVTLGEVLAASGNVVMEGADHATPVWAIALRGEMHNIRGLIDPGSKSAIFVIDAQTGEPVTFLPTQADWPSGFDALKDRAPTSSSPATSPRLPVIGAIAPIGDISARSACSGVLGSARLVAAFESTAGAVADWVENVSYPGAPHVRSSAWRALEPTAPAYVCYFDGQFAPPGGGPAPGGSVPPLVGRALVLIDSSGAQLGPSKYGPSDSLPLVRPGGRF